MKRKGDTEQIQKENVEDLDVVLGHKPTVKVFQLIFD